MQNGGSILTLTYYGAEQVMPHYNVMGVATVALTSVMYSRRLRKDGTARKCNFQEQLKTLKRGIGDFRYILKWNELNFRPYEEMSQLKT